MRKRGSLVGVRGIALVVPLVLAAAVLAGCDSGTKPASAAAHQRHEQHAVASQHHGHATRSPTPSPTPTSRARIAMVPRNGATGVRPDRPIRVRSTHGTLKRVRVITAGERVRGTFSDDRRTWTARPPLANDSVYRVRAAAVDGHGRARHTAWHFRTLTPRAILGTDIYPLDGQTVGVGMPIVIKFTAPIADDHRDDIQRRLSVQTSRHVEGSWHWFGDSEIHWRPRHYWPADTDVALRINTNGATSGLGAWGIKDKVKRFHIGRAVITRIDLKTDYARVFVDHKLARRIPVTGGKHGWRTRSGTKVILAKQTNILFKNEAIGAKEHYRLRSKWALRVTWSGEFLHTATWSEWAQGRENVSHGCVGMNARNSGWLWHIAKVGDPVETTGTHKYMPVTGNGYGDWNLSWSKWKAGSAL